MKIKQLIMDHLMISIRQFAKEVGLNRQTIYNILNDVGTPSVLTVKKVTKYFGVDYKEYI